MENDDLSHASGSTYFTMKAAGGLDAKGKPKVGNLEIEVPDDGVLAPIERFENVMSAETKKPIAEIQALIEKLIDIGSYARNDSTITIDVTPLDVKDRTFTIYIMWVPDRKEWVGITNIYWHNASDWSNDFVYDGPYTLDGKFKKVIVGAYGLTEDIIGRNQAVNTEPINLSLLRIDVEKKANEAMNPGDLSS